MNWISDGITRIRNANMLKRKDVIVRGTKEFLNVLKIMKEEGLIEDYASVESEKLKQACLVKLSYRDNRVVIRGLKTVSNPSLRVYIKAAQIKYLLKRFVVPIISTSQGMMSGKVALAKNLGGELICEVM